MQYLLTQEEMDSFKDVNKRVDEEIAKRKDKFRDLSVEILRKYRVMYADPLSRESIREFFSEIETALKTSGLTS